MKRHVPCCCVVALWALAMPAYAQYTAQHGPLNWTPARPVGDMRHGHAAAPPAGEYVDDGYGEQYGDEGAAFGPAGSQAGCSDCDDGGWQGDWCGAGGCGPRFWERTEMLVWWVRGANTPPLVTTSPAGTPQGQAGVLPAATVLFGNERVDTDARIGARQTIGYWFDDCGSCGLEANFFGLETLSTTFLAEGNGAPIIGRPFFNVQTQAQDAGLQSFPGIVAGSVGVTTDSSVIGAELNIRKAVHCDQCMRVEFLGGYRFLRFDESLYVNENTTSTDPNGQIPLGTMIDIYDRFGTQNEFQGGNLGLMARFQENCWAFSIAGKLGVGDMRQQVSIGGNTAVTVPGVPTVTSDGGFLALSSNSGIHTRDRICVLPELTLNLQYQINCTWRANFGYTLLYLTRVVRPGDQVNLNIDPNLFPPPVSGTQPSFAFNESDVWMQGFNFGLEAKF